MVLGDKPAEIKSTEAVPSPLAHAFDEVHAARQTNALEGTKVAAFFEKQKIYAKEEFLSTRTYKSQWLGMMGPILFGRSEGFSVGLRKTFIAGGAAIGVAMLDSVISRNMKNDLARDVFAPNSLESLGIGIAVTRLPKGKLALGIAAGSWIFGRTENFLEHEYHIEEKLSSASHRTYEAITDSSIAILHRLAPKSTSAEPRHDFSPRYVPSPNPFEAP